MKPHFKEAFNLQSNSHFKTIDEGSLISFQYKVRITEYRMKIEFISIFDKKCESKIGNKTLG